MYPKMLYLKGWDDIGQNKIVNDPAEEKEARKKGYKAMDDKPTRRRAVTTDDDK